MEDSNGSPAAGDIKLEIEVTSNGYRIIKVCEYTLLNILKQLKVENAEDDDHGDFGDQTKQSRKRAER